ncbi:MAG: AbrB/MazE/SpoVT family DNA-binding domain-containing protein [Parcubacteria group bacterium]|nr:AbrB/MazE/SpoVT family DNA-binding domain-containing protein [Parcubacteria group bacterium]
MNTQQLKQTAFPLVKVKSKGQVTLPVRMREKLHLEDGNLLEVFFRGNEIVLRPKAVVDRHDLKAYLKEGIGELRVGKTVGPFKSMKEYEAHIKRTP